ncbi:hypothetical protein ACKC5O_13275 [Aeromonas schubertii]|uniref:Uncharacterized protein n=2 Tax=Aeromonas schubertii TaxID=652 RepID=A0ABS7VAQ3_9GAMM|nr:hypothetical protein [Aeromonas schubertii]KUE78394.1 hypothetical protein ATO46_10395 [Aeromonas schubertii]MBZ6066455.1 hypothetical protein [Aeromonas schubertii]
MRHAIKLLAVAGLMTAGVAQASVPADFSAVPGVLMVKWHDAAAISGASTLEVRDAAGELLASVPARTMGTQQIALPYRAQGTLSVSLGDQSSDYRIPYGIGDGRQR